MPLPCNVSPRVAFGLRYRLPLQRVAVRYVTVTTDSRRFTHTAPRHFVLPRFRLRFRHSTRYRRYRDRTITGYVLTFTVGY